MTIFRGLTLAGVAVVATMLATPAFATLEVRVNPTGTVGTVTGGTLFTDEGVGDTCAANIGSLCFPIGGANISVSVAGANSTSPFGTLSVTVIGTPLNTGSPLLTLAITDNGYTTPPVPLSITQDASGLRGSLGATGSVSAQGYFSSTNALFDTSGPTTGSTGSVAFGAATSFATSPNITSGSPYAMTSLVFVNVTALGTGTIQINANLDAVSTVPEPMSITLLGGVLLCTVGAIRRKARRA